MQVSPISLLALFNSWNSTHLIGHLPKMFYCRVTGVSCTNLMLYFSSGIIMILTRDKSKKQISLCLFILSHKPALKYHFRFLAYFCFILPVKQAPVLIVASLCCVGFFYFSLFCITIFLSQEEPHSFHINSFNYDYIKVTIVI